MEKNMVEEKIGIDQTNICKAIAISLMLFHHLFYGRITNLETSGANEKLQEFFVDESWKQFLNEVYK